MLLITVILVLVTGALIVEKRILQKHVDSIPLRIHINGTRGKSTVTEYIGAGILNADYSVIAKITGIIPAFFHNGKENIIRRTGAARIQEQFRLIRFASKQHVKSLVLECMSVSPELQRMESSVFQPHIYVITNIRNDHFESMGKNLGEVADQICSAIPANSTVITNELRFLDKIKEKAAERKSKVISLKELNYGSVENLPFGVLPENLFLALAACETAGIDHKHAREGILNWISCGKSPLITIKSAQKEVRFLNAFAANDVDSTRAIIDHWQNGTGSKGKISFLFNTRADRPIRTELFASWIAGISQDVEYVLISGDHSNRAKSSLLRKGITNTKVSILRNHDLRNLKTVVLNMVEDGSLLVGIGNIGGSGFHILNELK